MKIGLFDLDSAGSTQTQLSPARVECGDSLMKHLDGLKVDFGERVNSVSFSQLNEQ